MKNVSLGIMAALAAGNLVAAPSARAADQEGRARALTSLEQLINQKVTSVSKKEEKASQAPAAIYVITADDIRRSGVTSIAEALRMAPGISVARSGASGWAITSRGFNDQFANKLLVLIDGRSVYSPLFSGVYWDMQNVPLETVDRIEVIRGPAGTLWGANAVNGVINIITKPASETQGGVQETLIGNQDDMVSMRYGGKVGEKGHYRVYGMHQRRAGEYDMSGNGLGDDWKIGQGGFRTDIDINDRDNLTVQGDYYEGDENSARLVPSILPPYLIERDTNESLLGGNLLARWKREFSPTSKLQLKTYYDHTRIVRELIGAHEIRSYDVELQHSWMPNERNDLVWGLGYRLVDDNLDNSSYTTFEPNRRDTNLFSGFVQDKIALIPDEWFLTLGSKFEHNDFTGFEYQPNARLSWLVNENNTLWLAVSRAIRSPYRASDDLTLIVSPVPGAGYAAQTGDRSVASEELLAYEVGYRSRLTKDLAMDMTAYINDYSNLVAGVAGTPFFSPMLGEMPPSVIFPLYPDNIVEGRVYGFEATMNWQAMDSWALSASYSFLKMELDVPAGALPFFTTEGTTPQNQLNLRSSVDLGDNVSYDTMLYFTDNLSARDIDAYTRLDMRLGWKPVEAVEVSVAGQNLLDNTHPEFTAFTSNPQAQVGRAVYGKISWQF